LGGYVSPWLGGAVGAGAYDYVNAKLGGEPITPGKVLFDVGAGAITGGVLEGLVPKVRGGSNFDPFTSPRGFGPQAVRQYKLAGLGGAVDLGKDAVSPGNGNGNGNGCGCK
jgi:hypothetical protein